MRFLMKTKKAFLLIIALSTISVLYFTTIRAQTSDQTTDTSTTTEVAGCNNGVNSEQFLYCIMQNTYGVLVQVNNLPVYMKNLSDLAYSWLTADDSDSTANMQSSFATFTNTLLTNIDSQNAVQKDVMNTLFNYATSDALPNANDLSYTTLLGMPYFATDKRNEGKTPPPFNAPYNYIINASGVGLYHVMPSLSWNGSADDQKRYSSLYNTEMAAESFGGYVLSNLYAENQNGNSLSKQQTTLLTQASSSDWFSQIASERIGIVLRQILMFESQAYVLMTQMYSVQKQMLSAQVMTNAVIIALNQTNEQTQATKASGQSPAVP